LTEELKSFNLKAVPEMTQSKSSISPNNLAGFSKDLGMKPLKLSIEKSDSRLSSTP